MKGICISETKGIFHFQFEGETPSLGHKYQLESLQDGTLAQNSLFHSLLMVYYNSGQHSEDRASFYDFREKIKRDLGAGFQSYIYVEIIEGKPVIKHAKEKEDIPEELRRDPQMKKMVLGKLKSWSNYSKKQRMRTIDNLISEMQQVGINSKKFEEILKGINHEIV
jgi:hypothetical protein